MCEPVDYSGVIVAKNDEPLLAEDLIAWRRQQAENDRYPQVPPA